jgi:hypothetical protein
VGAAPHFLLFFCCPGLRKLKIKKKTLTPRGSRAPFFPFSVPLVCGYEGCQATLLRRNEGDMKALLRRNYGAIKAQLRRN